MITLSAAGNEDKQQLEDLQWPEHVCLVYDEAKDWACAVSRFLKAGLCRDEKCFCLLPDGFFSGGAPQLEVDGPFFRQAIAEGRLVQWHDAGAFSQSMGTTDGLTELLATRYNAETQAECRIACDMTWLKEWGFPEKWRSDLLAWLCEHFQDHHLLVMSGYDRPGTTSSELRTAFGMHSYIHHGGQLLPGGFGGTPTSAHARRFKPMVSAWRRTFRRGQVLDAIFKAAPFAMWMLDRNKEVVFVNRQVCEILGAAEEQILGTEYCAQPDCPSVQAVDSFALDDIGAYQTEAPLEKEQVFLHADGRLHDYRVIRTRVMGDDGQVEGLLGLALDITAHKKAERLLREGERRFRDIALSVGDLIWEVGPDWRFRYLSERASSIIGYAAETLVGRSLAEMDNAADADAWRLLFREWEKAPTTFRNVEKWLQHKDGRQLCLLLSGMPIFDEDGMPDGFRGVAEDITERKQQEASLKNALWEAEDARDKIDSILRSITDALVVIDHAGRVVMLNPRAEALFDTTAEQAVGLHVYGLCQGDAVRDGMMQLLESATSEVREACFAWPAGAEKQEVFFKARASRVRNMQGENAGSIVIFQDMTSEREMERVKTEFISTAAHELRTPLTSIMGYMEFCMHPEEFGGFSAAQLKEFMSEIYDKAEVLERIVSDLLDISRIEAGRDIPLVMESVNVEEISRKLLKHFQLQFPHYRFEMEFAAGGSHLVRADREKLVQVMENLISNAVKYSAEGSSVRVTGVREPACYRISVRDKGIGMTPAQIERMFERFYRAVDLNSGVRGLGLGMHIVKHIIERHGGTIQVVSAPRQGTEIIFTLPFNE
jgi:PAS domain S-box-containing protein